MKLRTKSWPVAAALSAVLAGSVASAQTPAASTDPPLTVRVSLKSSALFSRAPDASWLFPSRNSATGFWRARVEPNWRLSDRVSFDAAYEQRLRVFSSTSSALGAGVLPQEADPPYRLTALDWTLSSGAHVSWRHEIDRAAMHLRLPATEITMGRQAIGWGRGVLFSAVDVFAPFSPLEADREWRRGIDAVRADVKLTERASIEGVGAFGRRPSESVYAVRVRGYTDAIDVEATAGRRARDRFAGLTTSFALGGAELHGEAAIFRTPAADGSVFFARPRTVTKAVVGGSYRFALGAGLLVEAEYHYSGFGATSAHDTIALLTDAEFARRYLRGDTQILSRHALAAIGSYEWSPLLSGGIELIYNPVDHSGLVVPSLTVTPGDRWSLLLSAYAPFGRKPDPLAIRSEYGLTPMAAFAQVRVYR